MKKTLLDKNQEVTCSKCGDSFKLKNGIAAGAFKGIPKYYCGYCATVVLGDVQFDYPPRPKCQEDIEAILKFGHITNRP